MILQYAFNYQQNTDERVHRMTGEEGAENLRRTNLLIMDGHGSEKNEEKNHFFLNCVEHITADA